MRKLPLAIIPGFVVLSLSVFTLASCNSNQSALIKLVTDKAAIAPYAEIYNATHPSSKIEIIYSASVSETLIQNGFVCDIVIGDNLNSVRLIDKFAPLTDCIDNPQKKHSGINLQDFYIDLVRQCYYQGELVLLPVSFTIPAIMAKRTALSPETNPFYLNIDELQSLAIPLNNLKKNVLAFSPLWRQSFIYSAVQSMGAAFSEDPAGCLRWDDSALNDSITYLRNWITASTGSIESDLAFKNKYIKGTGYNLINSDRVSFYSVTATQFFEIPETKRSTLELRWLAYENRISVDDEILMTGIYRKSTQKKAASEFLRWFFSYDAQEEMMSTQLQKNIDGFGIMNGFSSLKAVNDILLPQYYSELSGFVPPERTLVFPQVMPAHWQRIKQEAVAQSLYDEVVASEDSDTSNFKNSIDLWYKHTNECF